MGFPVTIERVDEFLINEIMLALGFHWIEPNLWVLDGDITHLKAAEILHNHLKQDRQAHTLAARRDERKRMSYHIDRVMKEHNKGRWLDTGQAFIDDVVEPHRRRVEELHNG